MPKQKCQDSKRFSDQRKDDFTKTKKDKNIVRLISSESHRR